MDLFFLKLNYLWIIDQQKIILKSFILLTIILNMQKSYTIILIITFLVSCSSENTKQIEANLLIEPNYEFSAEFFECKFNDGYTLLNLESFLSTLLRSDLEQNNIKYDINVYFPKPNYVNQFIINVKNYSDQDIYNYILDRLSRRGFDEIAGCKFDKEELYGQNY